jgi:hypothetical protein
LFDPIEFRWIVWSDVFEMEESFETFNEQLKDNYPSPLYYASLLGITKAVAHLEVQGLDVNGREGKYSSALQSAEEGSRRQFTNYKRRDGAP